MNEFLPRTDSAASVVRASERSLVVNASSGVSTSQAKTEAGVQHDPRVVDRSTASASYARLRADIANIVADIRPTRAPASEAVAAADDALMSLMPQPVIILPLPPTNAKMVEFVAQVAQSLAQQAAQARAAQANATPMLAEAAAN